MTDRINEMLSARFGYANFDVWVTPYSIDTDDSLEECLEELFENNPLGITQWDIYGETIFDGPSITTGYVVAAWIENGKLKTFHQPWRII